MEIKKIVYTALVILYSSFVFGQDYKYQEDNGVKTFHNGSLMIKEDIPFLTVKGDAYEMGLQYGVLANDMLVNMDNTVDSLINEYIGTFFLKKWIAGIVLDSKIKKVEETMPVEYVMELKGMADGSDLKLKDLQTVAYFPQLFFKISCTAFIMKNDSGLVHGRNLDWPGIESLTHHPLIISYHKKDKIPVTILTFMGYPGVYTGMNHHGLSMSINMNGTPAENDKEVADYNTGMPLAFKLRNILENGDKISDVDKMFAEYSSHAWFITVGSKKDYSGAIYELTRGKVIKNTMNDDFISVVNLSLSDKGRYQYSPIWMFGTSNISRERKIKELYERIDTNDLVAKSYQILSNNENHHLAHDPFFGNSINNSMTVKSCIMDNVHNEIYFTYGERLAALNKYLRYNLESGQVSIYKNKQEFADRTYLDERLVYQNWYANNIADKKKLKDADYMNIIGKIEELKLEPAYKACLLSFYSSKVKMNQKAFENAEEYISIRPDYYHVYYNKYKIMKSKADYMGAVVALEEMLQTTTITPYYDYFAKVKMIEMYDRLLDQNKDEDYIDKIFKLAKQIRIDLNQYFIDKRTQEDLDMIKSIEEKYKN